jgi:hypothetical protein
MGDLWDGLVDAWYALVYVLSDARVHLIGSTLLSIAALVCSIVALTR